LGEVHGTRFQASRGFTIGYNPFKASWGILDLETCFNWLQLTRATPYKKKILNKTKDKSTLLLLLRNNSPSTPLVVVRAARGCSPSGTMTGLASRLRGCPVEGWQSVQSY
jgi:hypothetical protein